MTGPIIHPGLRTLLRLTLRGRLRRAVRGLRTVKGIAYALVSLAFLALCFGPAIANGLLQAPPDPGRLRTYSPLILFGVCVTQLMLARPEGGVPFLAAEVDFLFPGPYSRRQLLLYKIAGIVVTVAAFGLMMSLYLLPVARLWLAGFVGMFLAFLFAQLFSLAVMLLAATVAERAFTRGRKLVLGLVGIAVAVGVGGALSAGGAGGIIPVLTRLRATWMGVILLAPFEVFGRILGAETYFPELVGWGAAGLAIDAALCLLVVWLDADFLEASIAATQKVYDRIQNARRGNIWAATKPKSAQRRIPQLPRAGGAGPIAWRQLCAAVRGARGMLFTLGLAGFSFAMPIVAGGKAAKNGGTVAIGGLAILSIFFIPQMVRFDFRGDVDRIESLKTLPLSPRAIVIGELFVPVAIATFLQLFLIAAVGLYLRAIPPYALAAAACALPFNVIVFGLENLVFLVFPYRMAAGGNLDVSTMGRQMLIMLLKVVLLALVSGAAGGLGAGAYYLTSSSAAAVCVAWASSLVLAALLLSAVAWAYVRFDPSTDTPP